MSYVYDGKSRVDRPTDRPSSPSYAPRRPGYRSPINLVARTAQTATVEVVDVYCAATPPHTVRCAARTLNIVMIVITIIFYSPTDAITPTQVSRRLVSLSVCDRNSYAKLFHLFNFFFFFWYLHLISRGLEDTIFMIIYFEEHTHVGQRTYPFTSIVVADYFSFFFFSKRHDKGYYYYSQKGYVIVTVVYQI